MNYEVEQKFPLADATTVEQKLSELGATAHGPVKQIDRYYAHPSRDFAQTDEALRIRRVGDLNFITYKGPKVDQTTKTRRELEIRLPPGPEGDSGFSALLEAVGFRPVAEVRKVRRRLDVPWQGSHVEAALDQVDEVGTFLELELRADEKSLDSARQLITSLAQELGLASSERRSYLELLLAQRK
ncbi:MAG: class IV adenylate cyclase [Planctomycetaceae bacterium]|nr:class IV adenylate cyclase [Planctomycetaceae bacterium]